MTPKISIIIPCYNQEPYIDRCMYSVVNQTFTDWECLLINDGSTDKTEEISKNWVEKDDRVKYFSKENGGLSSARNFGMEKAEGKYLFFLDSDDRLTSEETLQTLINFEKEDADVITGNVNNETSDGSIAKADLNKISDKTEIYEEGQVLQAYLTEHISAVAWNKLYKSEFLKKYGFQFQKGLLHEDELWSLQIYLKAKKVVTVHHFTYNYYKGNTGSITANKSRKNYDSLVFIMKKIAEYAQSEEKLLSSDKNNVVRLFEKQYYFLKNQQVIKDRTLWTDYYAQIRKIYRNSILNSYQKRFVYPAELSYFALKTIKKGNSKNKSLLQDFLVKFITY